MTLGEKIKTLRTIKGLSQEKLAEELNISRSAIAKWETNVGIPEVSNLILLSKIFEVSLDSLLEDIKSTDKEVFNNPKASNYYSHFDKYVDIELSGWNDGVYNVFIINEDEDFLFYQKLVKDNKIFGMIGKKHITSVKPLKKSPIEQKCVVKIDRSYFCRKHVMLELVAKEGLVKGFFDFRNDDYRDVIIMLFESSTIKLQFGKEINLNEITKIEELNE